ncbi:malectin domain-containing carbohydrate-binding protein [Ferruginibacter sp.]
MPFVQSLVYLVVKFFALLCAFVSLWFNSFAQQNIREDILLNNDWTYSTGINNLKSFPPNTSDYYFTKVNIPHNADAYDGYRRLLHGNKHGDIWYRKIIKFTQPNKNRRNFLFFEGVGSYAKIYLNGNLVGEHAGGRTTFTIDVTGKLKTNGTANELLVFASHPANIKDLPWVCGGCSDERGFSEGSQPMGIFRPVHLIVTNDVRIEPFGVHAWAEIKNDAADLWVNTTFKNYSSQNRTIEIINQLKDAEGKIVAFFSAKQLLKAKDSIALLSTAIKVANPKLWSVENPYLYKIITALKENNVVIDKTETDFGFRTVKWNNPSHQFTLNGKSVFLNGIAEYEHLLGQSHAFSNEQIVARMKWIQTAGFNAFRDGHQPHNLLYGKLCNQKGILWWTQLSAHVWYDTKEFRENFKTLLREWVIERRNDPSVILWGLQNESKLPAAFAEECTALIRSLDPTASTQRLVTTCNGGEGTDWDVPQNWTGTYGGNPATYGDDLKKQILVGEYGAWRTIDLHSEGGFKQNGILSEDRMTQLMEQKIRLAEKVKDSVAGHFFWLLTSHDNPGRVQGGEGLRELDRIGPVNYKGLLTPWEEPTDAFYMFRSNYADKYKEPMVYIVSHTWPNRWMTPGIKDSIYVYSNCDEVELFNDIDNASLGKQKRNGIGTHFQWDKVNIQYNVLYAVGYINGKAVARDTITLFHLPQSPNFNKLYANAKNITKSQDRYQYIHRINCGGGVVQDENGNTWWPDGNNFSSWTNDFENMPKDFASQRRTFAPIKNTKDWKLFQSFRYGKDKMKFDFDVEDGNYLVELYFIEPWLGIDGKNTKGMRLFDVAANGKIVINDLDIWSATGTNTVVKKTFFAKAVNEKIIISFPESKVGQALISAIAIAKKTEYIGKRGPAKRFGSYKIQSWLDIGDKQFANESIQINSLPSNLFGADWVQLNAVSQTETFYYDFNNATDLFVAVKESYITGDLLKGFEHLQTQIITDEKGGTKYVLYRKRFVKDDTVSININSNLIICMQLVTNMQPAYDLKPVTAYRTNVATLSGVMKKESFAGRDCAVVKTNEQAIVEWPVQTGVADIYSVTIKYFSPNENIVKGKVQLTDVAGKILHEEELNFSLTKAGKWNQLTFNTGGMINAGSYTVKLTLQNAAGIAVSGIEIQ